MWTHYTIFGAALKIVVRPTGFWARFRAHVLAFIFWWLRSKWPEWKTSALKKAEPLSLLTDSIVVGEFENSHITTVVYGYEKKFIFSHTHKRLCFKPFRYQLSQNGSSVFVQGNDTPNRCKLSVVFAVNLRDRTSENRVVFTLRHSSGVFWTTKMGF